MLYSRRRLAKLLNVSSHLFSLLEREGILKPIKIVNKRRYYGFNEYLSLRTIQRLRENGISPRKMVISVKYAKRYFKYIQSPLTEVKFISVGKELFMKHGDDIINANGQYMISELFENEKPEVCPISKTSIYWFELASKYDQDPENYDKAEFYYKQALHYEPNMFEALLNLGTLYYKMGKIKLSERYYLKALKLDERNYLLLYNLGNLYDEKRDIDKAIKYYYSAIEEREDFADAHYNLALLYMKNGDWDRAIKHFQFYILMDPHSVWAAIARKQIEKLEALLQENMDKKE